jgi:hypothetical protein
MWKHQIIDNFLRPEHFDLLRSMKLPTCAPNQWLIYKNQCHKNGDITHLSNNSEATSSDLTLPPSLIEELVKTYNPKLFEILRQIAPEKVNQYKFTELNLVVTGKDYKFPIHNDMPSKLLSVVIYLTPENNAGTWLYTSESGENPLQVEWQQNRAVIFSRTDDTWHSYQSDGISPRFTLVYNIKS